MHKNQRICCGYNNQATLREEQHITAVKIQNAVLCAGERHAASRPFIDTIRQPSSALTHNTSIERSITTSKALQEGSAIFDFFVSKGCQKSYTVGW